MKAHLADAHDTDLFKSHCYSPYNEYRS